MTRVFILFLLLSNSLFSQKKISHDVYFDTDKYAVPLTEENRLLLFISSLDSLPIDKISIYGFCDDRGTNDYNLNLSQQRANTIKELFSEYGINDSLITNVNGKGEILLKVLKENEIHKIRGLNRKVEINVALKTAKPKDEKHLKQEESTPIENDSIVSVSKEKTSSDIEKGNIKKGDKIRLENIYFKTSYSSVLPKSKKTLEELAKILVGRERVYFTIQGHVCCTQNSRDAIDKKTGKRNLSVARAKYIYNYLAKKGVSKRRMKYVGMRRKFPLGGDPELDRRVEILITYVGKD